jgi:hypothetical protein
MFSQSSPMYTASIQIFLSCYAVRDYYWVLYQGPCGVAVNPCKPGAFKLAAMSREFDYTRNDIDHPPKMVEVSYMHRREHGIS